MVTKSKKILTGGNVKTESFNFELIEKYFKKKDNSNQYQTLSDKTCNDIDFSDLFIFLDRTQSKVGQQYLYNRLRVIPQELSEITKNEKWIEKFNSNSTYREKIQTLLSKLNSHEAYYIPSLFQDDHITPPKWFFIIPILSIISLLSILFLSLQPILLLVLILTFTINIVVHYWNKKNIYPYLASIPQLLKLNFIAKKLFEDNSLLEINPHLKKSIDLIDKVRYRMLFFKLEAKLQGDLEAIAWGILELVKILFLLEPILLFSVLKKLNTKQKEIESVFEFVGKIDVIISTSLLRERLDKYCLPEIHKTPKTLNFQDTYHPLIDNCTENSLSLTGKSILLTGSNMSGKSSFIRTVAINCITAQTINTCFANEFAIPKLKIYSAIRTSDDLINDKSYYFAEVLSIKEMIDNSMSEEPNLFLLDEIFKGTNTIERISAGKAVLSELNKRNNIVFVSTHDIELADLLNSEYDLFHFSEQVDNASIDFDYKLKPGKLKNRNAIRILKLNGYPDSVVNEALELSQQIQNKIISIE